MIYFFSSVQVIWALVGLIAFGTPMVKVSSDGLVTELESLYLKGEGIIATFSYGSENEISLVAALHSPKYKLETSQEMIVNDGAIVHRLNKERNEVVLDYARKKSSSAPIDLFNFSSNYTVKLLSSKGNAYLLQLTPKAKVEEIFQQAGITNLLFDLRRPAKGKPLQVVAITASGKGAKRKATNVMIAPVMKFNGKEFEFTSPKGAKVIDLTDE